MSAETVETFRYLYAVLSVLCATGFIATLVLRWEVLRRGERVLRLGLVAEHLVITYGAYNAIKLDYPTSAVALLITASMVVIITGFVLWLGEDLLRGNRDINRLTDPGGNRG